MSDLRVFSLCPGPRHIAVFTESRLGSSVPASLLTGTGLTRPGVPALSSLWRLRESQKQTRGGGEQSLTSPVPSPKHQSGAKI